MTGLWAYPWSFTDRRFEPAMDALRTSGIDHLKIAAHYHSVRTFDPKEADLGFYTFPGGCLFDPDERYFEQTPIDPPTNTIRGRSDAFGDVVATATARDIAVDAWLVCFHGTRLATSSPAYRIEDAFGDAHDHALCPSHPEVRRYFAGVVRNLAQYGVERIDLESLGFPSVVHDHGASFGHHKDHVLTNRADAFLVSQCFCDGCRDAARGTIDVDAAEAVVSQLCERYLTSAAETPPLSHLVEEHPELEALFAFRADVIGELLDGLASASGDTRLSYYLADGGGYAPTDLWPSGVTPDLLTEYVDDVTALCYVDDLEEIEARLTACRDSIDHSFDVGLTLDPSVVGGRERGRRLLTDVSDRIDGDVFVYNHALMTTTQLECVAAHGATRPR